MTTGLLTLLWIVYIMLVVYTLSTQYGYLLIPDLLDKPPEPWLFENIK